MTGYIATPSMADIQRLEKRIAALEKLFRDHGHPYAACYGPGGEWDKTQGPCDAKPAFAPPS